MADEADRAQDIMEARTDSEVQKIKQAASNIPKGNPGDCELCGEWSGRLVQGVCAPCRDKHNLP